MNEGAGVIIFLFVMMIIFISLLLTVLMTWAYCRICSKAGYSWALGLLMLVPVANFVLPLVLAFGDWPIQKEMRKLKSQQSSASVG
jgi:hypothetical protein